MLASSIIQKIRDGEPLPEGEITRFINAYVADQIPEYQVSAWLMAVFFRGLSPGNLSELTQAMIDSGERIDLSAVGTTKIDKHSTGGVGDKVSLILAPLMASCGLAVPMMSGRSLGHTGGTLDKLESIPGYSTRLDASEFANLVARNGYAMCGQSAAVVPADRRLYSLRDVTATVESIPLITASILSKKIAEGADGLVFDVKTGRGAFMKDFESSKALAKSLVDGARALGKVASSLVTTMDHPLGTHVGNFLEVEESYLCLEPTGRTWEAKLTGDALIVSGPSADLMELTLELGADMLRLAGLADSRTSAMTSQLEALASGKALGKFVQNVKSQGGDIGALRDRIGTWRAPHQYRVRAALSGFLARIDALALGQAGIELGIGRHKTEDKVLPHVGYILHAQRGDGVEKGDDLFTVYADNEATLENLVPQLEAAVNIAVDKPVAEPLIRLRYGDL